MKIAIKNSYKSLPVDLEINLPDFSVITGENGAGKIHLLEYISQYGTEDIKNSQINFVSSDWKAKSKRNKNRQ